MKHTGYNEGMLKPIQIIRNSTQNEELDYILLTGCLQKYASPRNVIHRLLRSGDLIRVKKGIYIFGPEYARKTYRLEVLANMIYGPSYVSREYALSYWGLIPEAVVEITSMTPKRNKLFKTPVGRFSYQYTPLLCYTAGITKISSSEKECGALIATPEKALLDLLLYRKEKIKTSEELKRVLIEDIRIDLDELAKLKINILKEIAQACRSPLISILGKLIKEIKNHV